MFRFWNIIGYCYSHKAGMSQDWFRVLSRYVPAFAQAQIRYHQLCRQLTAELRDSHAAAAGAVISRKQGRATLATAT